METTNKASLSLMSIVAIAFDEYRKNHGSEIASNDGLNEIASDVNSRIISITDGKIDVYPVFGLIGDNQLTVVDWMLNGVDIPSSDNLLS